MPAHAPARRWVSLIGTVLTGALGYLHYFVRSLTPEERVSSAGRRILTAPFRHEPHFPANRTFLKISSLNHAAVLGLGAVAALETGQSMLALAAPAVFLAGTLACLRVSENRPVNRWVRACEVLAIGAVGCLIATRIPVVAASLRALSGIRPVVLGIGAALLARTMAIAPLVLDAFRALRPESTQRGFTGRWRTSSSANFSKAVRTVSSGVTVSGLRVMISSTNMGSSTFTFVRLTPMDLSYQSSQRR